MIEYAMLPWIRKSLTPVIVAVCGAFQSCGVKVRLCGETVPWAVLLEARGSTTSYAGCDVRTAENAAVPPACVVVRSCVGLMAIPVSTPTRETFVPL
jgi:hypothetical protein